MVACCSPCFKVSADYLLEGVHACRLDARRDVHAHKDASREMARADRKLEARIGVLIGPAHHGGDRVSVDSKSVATDLLSKHERHEFRQIAEYQDHPEVAPLIEQGQSRRRVLRQIAEVKPVEAPVEMDPLKGESWELRVGDFRELLSDVPEQSVDMIVTDPPYPKDDLPLYSDLGELARRILKPRGVLFVWTGQIFLPEVIERLGEHMAYGDTPYDRVILICKCRRGDLDLPIPTAVKVATGEATLSEVVGALAQAGRYLDDDCQDEEAAAAAGGAGERVAGAALRKAWDN